VSVKSAKLNILFTIDISNKGQDYLSQFYDENGKLNNRFKAGLLL